jgi:hypothetical protein
MNRYRMLFVQASALPPHMHQNLTKHGRFCKQDNQLPTKSHDELKDNAYVAIIYMESVALPYRVCHPEYASAVLCSAVRMSVV